MALLAVALAAGVACSSSGASKEPTAISSAVSVDNNTIGFVPSAAADPTMAALQTLAPSITVLPDGQAVTNRGDALPAPEATQAADAVAGSPDRGQSPSGIDVPTPVPADAAIPQATEAPPCLVRPVSGCSTTIPVSTPIAPTAQGIVLDADPTTSSVEDGPIHPTSAQAFDVGIIIATVPQAYQGYEWDLVIDGPISFVKSDEAKPAKLTLCSATTRVGGAQANEYYGGCLSTDKNLTYTGPVGTITLQCTGPGAGQLRLRKQNEGGPFATDLLNQSAQPITGDVGPPLGVTCS